MVSILRSPPGTLGLCPKCSSNRLTIRSLTDDKQRIRYACASCGHRTTKPLQPGDEPAKARSKFKTKLPKARLFVFTAAQNATPIHKPFWKALTHYCKHFGAELIVSGYRYKNPTSQWTEKNQENEWWADEVVPFLYQTRAVVNENVEFLGDVFPQATAVKPLTGFESLTGDRSCIIPHPKVQLRTIATPAHQYPKIITTTGCVTVENYTATKTGKIADFHHTFGAVVVEVGTDGNFSMRQISALKNGSFYDISAAGVIKVDPDGITTGHKLAGLVMGDTHVDFVDPGVVAATFEDDDSIVSVGDPTWLVWHDLIDLYSRNRHANNPFIEIAKQSDGTASVYDELVRGWAFHDEMARSKKSAVINSNHTNARLDRYMQDTDWRADPKNAHFYLETALQMVNSLRAVPNGHAYDDPFVWWGKKLSKAPNVVFPNLDDPFLIAGVECGFHGHIGPGAARSASLDNMRRIGAKTIFGHVHQPGTEEGTMSVGTSTLLRLGYNAGPSAWMNSHAAIYPNGKRTHLFIFGGKWHHL